MSDFREFGDTPYSQTARQHYVTRANEWTAAQAVRLNTSPAVILAAVRFLASPIQEHRLMDAVTTSLRWVDEGIIPRKLTQ